MLGLIVLLLAVALPLGIVFLTVRATEGERKVYDHSPVRRLSCALVFGLAAVLGVLWVLRGTGPEYATAMGLFLGLPASGTFQSRCNALRCCHHNPHGSCHFLSCCNSHRTRLGKFVCRCFRGPHRFVSEQYSGSGFRRPCRFVAQPSFQPQAA